MEPSKPRMSQPVKKSASKPEAKVRPSAPTGKRLIVFGIPVIAAIWMHICIGIVLQSGLAGHWWIVGLGVVAFCLVLATTGLAAAVVAGPAALWIVPLGVAASSVLTGVAWQVGIGAAIEAVTLALLMANVRHEVSGRLRFSVVKILTYGMTLTIGLMLLAIGFFSYAGFIHGASTGRLQSTIVDGTVKTLNASIPLIVKGYSSEMTVDELIEQELPDTASLVSDLRQGTFSAAERQTFEDKLREAGIDPSAVDLDKLFAARPNERVALLNDIDSTIAEARQAAVDAARDRVGRSFGVTLTGTETVNDALHAILTERVARLTRPNERFVPPLLAISLFLTLEIFTALYLWLTWLLGTIVFAIYRSSNLVTKVEETVEAVRYEVI